jgi:hypothetical protein
MAEKIMQWRRGNKFGEQRVRGDMMDLGRFRWKEWLVREKVCVCLSVIFATAGSPRVSQGLEMGKPMGI